MSYDLLEWDQTNLQRAGPRSGAQELRLLQLLPTFAGSGVKTQSGEVKVLALAP